MLSMLQDAGFDARIGVYVCHCGLNIAGVVDVEAVRESARFLQGVVVVRDNRYKMCIRDRRLSEWRCRAYRC